MALRFLLWIRCRGNEDRDARLPEFLWGLCVEKRGGCGHWGPSKWGVPTVSVLIIRGSRVLSSHSRH